MIIVSRFAKNLGFVILMMLVLAGLASIHPSSKPYIDPWTNQLFGEGGVALVHPSSNSPKGGAHGYEKPKGDESLLVNPTPVRLPPGVDAGGPLGNEESVRGGVIMGKLGNETAKAALGRATWKLLHTMTLRYPEKPTMDERRALDSYFHLSSRLYPCGECAAEFQMLLKKYPPQTASRKSASLWLCALHNKVNERLKKPIFDCAHLSEEYDCGCGDSPVTLGAGAAGVGGRETHVGGDADDLERDTSRDSETGAELVRGGR